jgi:uncharacterized protein (TIGR02145 family)
MQASWYYHDGAFGTDDYGFRVLPSGYRNKDGASFNFRGNDAYFWSSSASSVTDAWSRQFYSSSATVGRHHNSRSFGFSVRCIRDCMGAPTGLTLTANPATVCDGEAVTLTAAGIDGTASYSLDGITWQPDNTFSAASVNDTSYTLYVQTAAGCSFVLENAATVTVNPLPVTPTITISAATVCQNAALTFRVTTPVTGATYTWTASAGTASGTGNGTYTFNTSASGAKTATVYSMVTAGGVTCRSANAGATATVNPLPSISAVTSPAICYGATATLSATLGAGTTTAMTYTWNIGGVSSTTTANSRISPPLTAITTYTVQLTNAYGCVGAVSAVGTVTVNPLPAVSAVTSPAICYGATAALSATLGAGTTTAMTYTWNIGGVSSTTTAGSKTSPALTTTTTYTVQLTNTYGCAGAVSAVGTVTVHPPFTAGTIASTGQALCMDDTPTVIGNTTLASGGSGTISYQWYKDGSIITGATAATYTPFASEATLAVSAASATYTYTRHASAALCGTQAVSAGSWVLTVYRRPAVSGVLQLAICYGATAVLSVTPTGAGTTTAMTYTWNIGGVSGVSSSITTASSMTSPPLTGVTTYTVRVTNAYGCRSTAPVIRTITVRPQFTAGTIASTGQALCVGGKPTIIGNTTPASGGYGDISYQWYKGASSITGATAAAYTPPASDAAVAGVITYTRRASAALCGTQAVSAGSWVLNVVAAPTVTVSPSESVCYGTAPSAMTATVSGGAGTPSYQWRRNGLSLGDGAQALVYSPGVLTATATYSMAVTQTGNGCSATSGNIVVTVHPQFTAGAIASTGQSLCVGGTPVVISNTTPASGGSGAISYQWYKWNNGLSLINGATAAAYTPPASDAAVTATITYTRRASAALCGPHAESMGSRVLHVVAMPTVTVSSAETFCYGTRPNTMKATVSGGTGAITGYFWYQNGVAISGTDSYAPDIMTATATFTLEIHQAGSGCSATSGNIVKAVYNNNMSYIAGSSANTATELTAMNNVVISVGSPAYTTITHSIVEGIFVNFSNSSGTVTISGTPLTYGSMTYSLSTPAMYGCMAKSLSGRVTVNMALSVATVGTWTCGNSPYLYSTPVKVVGCNSTNYTVSLTENACRNYTSGGVTSYYYNAPYVEFNNMCSGNWHKLTQAEADAIKNNCTYATAAANIGLNGWVDGNGTPHNYGNRGYAWIFSGDAVTTLLKLKNNTIITYEIAGKRSDGHQVICARFIPQPTQQQGSCTYTAPALAGTFESFPSTYSAATYVSLTDARDGKVYPVVKIGGRWVMARNLNYQAGLTWQANSNSPSTVPGSNPALRGHFWCPGGEATVSTRASCEAWGALYSWETAMMVDGKWSDDNRNTTTWGSEPTYGTNTTSGNTNNGGRGANGHGICPPNWHIPTDLEWGELLNAMESGSGTTHNTDTGYRGVDAGARARSKCMCASGNCATDQIVGWGYNSTASVQGTDFYGFRVLPTGYRPGDGDNFSDRGYYASFWSSSSAGGHVWERTFFQDARAYRSLSERSSGYSVRCMRNQ